MREIVERAGQLPAMREGTAATAAEVAELRAAVAALHAELAPMSVQLRFARREARQRFDVVTANQELIKGEFRSLLAAVDELGFAFAPATGLAGAGARFAELRESVRALEHRIRNLASTGPGSAPHVAAAPQVAAAVRRRNTDEAAPTSTLFDYVGFERRFRGDPEAILADLEERYADLLATHQPVVDIGCGRGELLERLAHRGIDVIGIDPDPGMVAEGRARGITVHQALAGDYLRGVEDHSLGAVISTHVVEHLQLDDLIEMLELSLVKLAPGGIFVAETPDPQSLIVLGNSYLLDPTHVWPLHPALLAFLCESAGYRDVRLRFFSPAQSYQLAEVSTGDDAPRWAVEVATGVNAGFRQLNAVLFGPQEYAVVATTPPAPDEAEAGAG